MLLAHDLLHLLHLQESSNLVCRTVTGHSGVYLPVGTFQFTCQCCKDVKRNGYLASRGHDPTMLPASDSVSNWRQKRRQKICYIGEFVNNQSISSLSTDLRSTEVFGKLGERLQANVPCFEYHTVAG
jgi:hypothetical protein